MTEIIDQFANPNDPNFKPEEKEKPIIKIDLNAMWNDYQYKKNQALKFMRLYEANNNPEGSSTLLKKAEKWQSKAQLVLDKYKMYQDAIINNNIGRK